MDVQCDKCSTEYEFDASRIPPQGLPVKCSSCAHVFTVHQENSDTPSEDEESQWQVRQAAGNVFKFKELTTLQRWIVERKVSREDEISKTGKSWQRLGDISELATFFQLVDAADTTPSAGQERGQTDPRLAPIVVDPSTMQTATHLTPARGTPAYVAPPPASTVPPPFVPASATSSPPPTQAVAMQTVKTPAASTSISTMQPSQTPSQTPAERAPTPVPYGMNDGHQASHGNDYLHDDQQSGDDAREVTSPGMPKTPITPTKTRREPTVEEYFYDDEPHDQEVLDSFRDLQQEGSGGRAMKAIMVVLLLAIVGGGFIYTQRPDLVQTLVKTFEGLLAAPTPTLAVLHVTSGREAWLQDTDTSLAEAKENFSQALTIAPGYADALAGIARSELNMGENLKVLVTLDPAKDTPELQARAAAHEKAAFEAATKAVQIDQENIEANLAMADYYRLRGASSQLKPLLKMLELAGYPQQGSSLGSSLAYIKGANLENDAGAVDRAARYFDAALEDTPEFNRARYKLAALYATVHTHQTPGGTPDLTPDQTPDKKQAKAEAAAQPTLSPENLAKATLNLELLLKAAPGHELGKLLLASLTPTPAVEAPTPPKKSKPMTFNQLVNRAERLRTRDQIEKAMNLYERALEMQPGDPDAQAGMAWCYFDLDNHDAAISSFKQITAKIPRYSDAHMGLAEAYSAKGMKRDAIKHYQKYLDILPDGPDSPVAKRALQDLQ